VKAIGGSDYAVRGNLTLHGKTHAVDVKVHLAAPGKYTGAAKVKQTDYGITPISIGGGAVKVKDEVDIEFVIVLKPAA
jgi:polyisoprenoid-binding protein YceI